MLNVVGCLKRKCLTSSNKCLTSSNKKLLIRSYVECNWLFKALMDFDGLKGMSWEQFLRASLRASCFDDALDSSGMKRVWMQRIAPQCQCLFKLCS